MGKFGLSEERYRSIFDRLNDDQKQVVLHESGPALTLSSAGSGKTATVVARVFHLIHKREIKPGSILAITFTKKAAEEMRHRMSDALEGLHDDIVEKIKFKTIHSFCMDLYNKTMFSMDPLFDKPAIFTSKLGMFWPAFIKLATKSDINLCSAQMDFFLSEVGFMKRSMISIEDYAKARGLIKDGKLQLEVVTKKNKQVYTAESSVFIFYNFYEKWKMDNNCMDFDDMLWFAYDCLIDSRKRTYAEPHIQRLEEIIIDESQDTSTLSFRIVDELQKVTENILLVGDTRQGIYLFAGADPKNIVLFRDTYSPKIFDLRINYRSTETIVGNANRLISNANGVIGQPAIAFNKETDKPIEIFVSGNEQMEAEKIAESINYLVNAGGVQPQDIAVLYRVHSQAVALEDALYTMKIPYYSYSKRAFYERKEILDVLVYLKILSDPMGVTKLEFKRIVNKPNNFISANMVDEIFDIKKSEGCSIISAVGQVSAGNSWGQASLNKFHMRLLTGAKYAASADSVDKVIGHILNEMGYLDYMKEVMEIRDAEVDVEGNFDAIRGAATRFSSIEDFLDHIQELKSESDKDEDGNYVKLMTIHASKGREWDHVFISGICDRIYPFHRCTTQDDLEQERRVMYVGVTRPKKELHLSAIDGKYGRFNVAPSPFIFDMNVDYHGARSRDLGGNKVYETENRSPRI